VNEGEKIHNMAGKKLIHIDLKLIFLILITGSFLACNVDKQTYTELLTSHTWGKPEILHHPPSESYTINNCGQYHNFKVDGSYYFYDDCYPNISAEGKWTWEKMGQEIRLETTIKNIPQKAYSILVYELSDNLFHTKEREEQEPPDTENYWEKVYRPILKKP
jgi:hypothetical protein